MCRTSPTQRETERRTYDVQAKLPSNSRSVSGGPNARSAAGGQKARAHEPRPPDTDRTHNRTKPGRAARGPAREAKLTEESIEKQLQFNFMRLPAISPRDALDSAGGVAVSLNSSRPTTGILLTPEGKRRRQERESPSACSHEPKPSASVRPCWSVCPPSCCCRYSTVLYSAASRVPLTAAPQPGRTRAAQAG